MKNKIIIITSLTLLSIININAQTINWKNINQKNILNLNAGLEYGLVYGVGYGHQLKCKLPIIVAVDFSLPSGNKLFDDFKTKIGGHIKLVDINDFALSVKAYGIFRRNENDFVRLTNFGSDFTGVFGYFRRKWFLTAEFGFDKAIVTQFKNSESYRNSFPAAINGWYEPATGGNYHCGLEAGYSFNKIDLYLKGGKIIEQDFKTEPLMPLYAQFGFNIKFNK